MHRPRVLIEGGYELPGTGKIFRTNRNNLATVTSNENRDGIRLARISYWTVHVE